MTRVGHNGIQRSEKVARRAERKSRRQHRAVAGAAALATVAAIGAGQVVEPAPAEAAIFTPPEIDKLIDWSDGFNPSNPLGDLISGIGNSELIDKIEDQWRVQTCVSSGSSEGADCSRSDTSLGGLGIAVVLPDRIEVVPVAIYDPVKGVYDRISGSLLGDILRGLGLDLPPTMTDPPATSGSSTVMGNGFQLAVAFRGGEATAISFLPLSLATAGASDGKTAMSLAVLGMAHGWNTGPLDVTLLGSELLTIPGVQGVGCYGGLTAAYAEGVGACTNVGGILDFRWKESNGEVQFGLTDPTALLSDPSGVLGGLGEEVLGGLLAGLLGGGAEFDSDLFSLSKDFARVSIGGDHGLFSGQFIRLTSDYGFTEPVTIDWLGQKVTFFPATEVNGESRPNYFGLPVLELGRLDTGELIPVLRVPSKEFPFRLPSTDPVTLPSSAAPQPSAVTEVLRTSSSAVTTSDDSEVPSLDGDDTVVEDSYVGKHRAAEESYVGKHRAPEAVDSGAADAPGPEDTDAGSGEAGQPDTDAPDADTDLGDSTDAADGGVDGSAGDADESPTETPDDSGSAEAA